MVCRGANGTPLTPLLGLDHRERYSQSSFHPPLLPSLLLAVSNLRPHMSFFPGTCLVPRTVLAGDTHYMLEMLNYWIFICM